MADHTKIEWTDATWNIINGCTVVSPGCTNCYAMRLAGTRLRHHPSREGLTIETKAGPVWNGKVRLYEPWLSQPLEWAKPRDIFVNAHGDLFHDMVSYEMLDRVFAVIALCAEERPDHRFQLLTKRSSNMRFYMSRLADRAHQIAEQAVYGLKRPMEAGSSIMRLLERGPLPNVWLGVSAEDQQRADERIPDLLATPAAVRWISAEPLLGPINLKKIWLRRDGTLPTELSNKLGDYVQPLRGNFTDSPVIDWVVAGGESGNGARPMHPAWPRSLRDQCAEAGTAFHFKQWGEHIAHPADEAKWPSGSPVDPALEPVTFDRVGKKAAGRLLDGIEHNGYPA